MQNRESNFFINSCIELLGIFTKSNQPDLRQYCIKLKHVAIRKAKNNSAFDFDNIGDQMVQTENAYSLVMKKPIYNAIYPLFFCHDMQMQFDNLNRWLIAEQVRFVTDFEGNDNTHFSKGIIVDHPTVSMLWDFLQMGRLMSQACLLPKYSSSMSQLKNQNEVQVPLFNVNSVIDLEKLVSIANGFIAMMFEYASSSTIRYQIRLFERPFKHRQNCINKAISKYS